MTAKTAKTPKTAADVVDPALLAYVSTESDEEAERLLTGALFREHLEPVGRAVVRRRLRGALSAGAGSVPDAVDGDAADEAFGELVTQLLRRLRALREEWRAQAGPGAAIANLDAYVAVAAGRACDDLMRRRFPARARLKNRVRYLLSHTEGLGHWEAEAPGGPAPRCVAGGYEVWRGRPAAALAPDPASFLRLRFPGGEAAAVLLAPAASKTAAQRGAGGPVALDDLVDLLAVVWRMTEPLGAAAATGPAGDDEQSDPLAAIADPGVDVAGSAERREQLARLWDEVRRLPHRQCAALLLNLRDGETRGVIALLPMLGVARVSEIAEAVRMDAAEFAALWDRLPLEDAVIAELLGATRQQVINLRKVARERLARRTAAAVTSGISAARDGNTGRAPSV